MKPRMLLITALSGLLVLAYAAGAPAAPAAKPLAPASLAGAWTLVAADVLHPDGTRAPDYGASPKGLLLIDGQGRYAVQIYKAERPRFASPDKRKGTPAELEAAVLGSSAHFGTIEIDTAKQALIYRIEGAAFPNWEGTQQVRRFELQGDQLSYRVPPLPNGDIPISVWRRIK